MPFIISAGTSVTGLNGAGIQSVNLTMNPQIQRMYQIGSIPLFDKNVIEQYSLNLTRYSGQSSIVSPNVDVSTYANCAGATPINIRIDYTGCGSSTDYISKEWFVTSYSYNKDIQGWGMETWGFTTKPITIGQASVPTMIRGVAEGQISEEGGVSTGIVLAGVVNGKTLEVTAGSPGVGKVLDMKFGEVSYISGGTGKLDGSLGTGSVSVPYSPIFLG